MSKYENLSLRQFLEVLMTPEGYYVDAGLDMEPFLDKQVGNDRKKLVKIEAMIKERISEYYKNNTISPLRTLDDADRLSPTYLTEYRAFDRLNHYVLGNEEYALYLDGLMYDLGRDIPDSMYYDRISELENQLQMNELQYIKTFEKLIASRLSQTEEYTPEQFPHFATTMTENQVRYLYNALKEKRYIASDTTEEVFFSVFQSVDCNQEKIVPQKVVWEGQINQYTYLIDSLLRHNYMNDTKIQWKITRSCIELESYGNLARIMSKFKAAPTSAAKPIDEILDALATVK